jgi:hypothetical protein
MYSLDLRKQAMRRHGVDRRVDGGQRCQVTGGNAEHVGEASHVLGGQCHTAVAQEHDRGARHIRPAVDDKRNGGVPWVDVPVF